MPCYIALILKTWANTPIITHVKIPTAICLYRIVKVLKIAVVTINFFETVKYLALKHGRPWV